MEGVELVGGASLTLTGTQFNNGLPIFGTTVSGTGSLIINLDPNVLFLPANFTIAPTVLMTVNGTSGDDVIKAGNTTNTINAGDGVDFMRGGMLADIINAGGGNDKIYGFGGADVLTGGGGVDQFRYLETTDSGFGANSDRITDFTIGTDKLDFRLFDPNSATPEYELFSFVGTGAFTGGGAASIRYTGSGADLLLQVDVNGDGVADMEIILQGLNGQTLTSGDFMFV
jgi:Ca2+-binding RTX toxin-like protein